MAFKNTTAGYAIVQHSAAGYRNDPRFERGLETRSVDAKVKLIVESAGGVVFDTLHDADEACFKWMYPDGSEGLVPQARGTWEKGLKVDGLKVYVPVRAIVG